MWPVSDLFLRTGIPLIPCGPGTRRPLGQAQGSGASTDTLIATGDTWNIPQGGLPGNIFAAGTWTARLILKKDGFATATVHVVVQRVNSSCIVQEFYISQSQDVASSTFKLITFSGSVDQTTFAVGDALLCIVSVTVDSASIEYNQPGVGAFSLVETPALVTVRPREYYRRNQRRRSC